MRSAQSMSKPSTRSAMVKNSLPGNCNPSSGNASMTIRVCQDSAAPMRPGWVIFSSGANELGRQRLTSPRRWSSSNSAIANAPAGDPTVEATAAGKMSGAPPRATARFHSHTI
jgi:hypothetical protein